MFTTLVLSHRNEGHDREGVFSEGCSRLARSLLFEYGTAPPDLLALDPVWRAVVAEVVPGTLAAPQVVALMEEALAGSSAVGFTEHDYARLSLRFTLLFHGSSAQRVERSSQHHSQIALQRLRDAGLWAAVGLGAAAGALDVPLSWQGARLALGFSLSRGSGLHTFLEEREVSSLVCPTLTATVEELPARLQGRANWRESLSRFFEVLPACGSVRRLHQEVQTLFSRVADLVPSSHETERYYHIADFVRGPEELRQALETLCRLALDALKRRGSSLAERKVEEFRGYVGKHYGDGQLDLRLVCSELQISPSYLGKILRRELKTTFVEYVTATRMARSRELLSGTDLLTSEIAERVGFVYTHYFSATFKKHYARTPSEFRALCRSRP